MPLSVEGTIERGMNKLHRNMGRLVPILAVHYPGIAKCASFGSINVFLDHPIYFAHADYWTPKIRWRPDWFKPTDPDREEAFGFVAIKFECPPGGASFAAWVFMPEGSGITHGIGRIEVIADTWVAEARIGARCRIEIDHILSSPRPPWFGNAFGFPNVLIV